MTSRAEERGRIQQRGEGRIAVVRAGIVLGLGLGGFFDGIVFHQVLQWHHMTSTPNPPTSLTNLQINTFADGLFHVATWMLTLAGVFLLWRAAAREEVVETAVLVGALLVGFGLFNLTEGLVNHFILGIHHVRESAPASQRLLYDLAFLAWGAVMVALGFFMIGRRREGRTGS